MRYRTIVLAVCATLTNSSVWAVEKDPMPAPQAAQPANNQTAGAPQPVIGAAVIDKNGQALGFVRQVSYRSDGTIGEIVVTQDGAVPGAGRPGMANESHSNRKATSLDAYVDRWRESIDQWTDIASDRSTEEVDKAWQNVERRWEELEKSSAQTWERGRDAFEAAFESFEKSWASSTTRSPTDGGSSKADAIK